MRVQWFKWTLALACCASMGLFATACNDDSTQTATECESPDECDEGFTCDDGLCVVEEAGVCGDGIVQFNEECDTAIAAGEPGACPTTDADCPSSASGCRLGKVFGEACEATCGLDAAITDFVDGDGCCPDGGTEDDDSDCVDLCGNGVVDDGEACDDGEENGQPNKCNNTCDGPTPALCGNSVVEDGEDCDSGGEDTDECNYDCTLASCGDGHTNVAAGETCDDGEENGQPGKCNEQCNGMTGSVCGNGVIEDGEACDDGGESATCNENCTVASCGDGLVNETAGETCDDGDNNGMPNYCNATCDGQTAAICGNGITEAGETCDDGSSNGTPNHCNETCDGQTDAVCGNGVIEDGEVCDDGSDNGTPNHCNDTCSGQTGSVCGNGVIEDGEACDDGPDNGQPNKCSAVCDGITPSVCGNGVIETGETCDDGPDNGTPNNCNDTCDGTTAAICGNGVREAGETCDDGPDNGTPNNCNDTCDGTTAAVCGNGVIETGETCDDGNENGDPNMCNTTCDGTTTAVCGNGVIETGETCDDGANNGEPTFCNEQCTGPTGSVCGNGVVEDGEDCDDGGESATCNANCTAATCGDGITNAAAGETCDDGANNGEPNQCNSTCDGTTTPVCGNDVVEAGEDCDDGGESAACNADCTAASCGDGVVNATAGETCDDGAQNGDPNMCNSTCDGTTASVCGNSIVEAGEDCDDGGESATCNDDCTIASCGDGIINAAAGETCDDGAQNGDPHMCNTTCDGTTAAVCGNGVVEAGEDCDDGGESATCNDDCTVASCGDGIVNAAAGETCDDGAQNGDPNMCNSTCNGTTAAVCGNNIVEAGEDCDDGGESATCNDDCSAAVCGDGIVNATAGEECDDGGPSATCDASCQVIEGPTAFRIKSAEIIDPHMFFDVDVPFVGGCFDVTSDGVLGQLDGGVNGMLKDALEEVIEGVYSMSIALLMRPLTQVAEAMFDAELRLPICEEGPGQCTDDPTQPIVFATATNRGSGACFPPSEHLGRNASYGATNNPQGPCFRSEATNVYLSIADIDLELIETSVAATYNADPATNLVNGLLVGFLTKTAADAAEIVVDAPVVGGTYRISDFLKGAGGCGSGNDMDELNGEPGWWFYLNFEAEIVDAWQE